MADEPLALATVIKKDGTVPFDDDVPESHRLMHLGGLALKGHQFDAIPDTRHVKIRDFKGHPRPQQS